MVLSNEPEAISPVSSWQPDSVALATGVLAVVASVGQGVACVAVLVGGDGVAVADRVALMVGEITVGVLSGWQAEIAPTTRAKEIIKQIIRDIARYGYKCPWN